MHRPRVHTADERPHYNGLELPRSARFTDGAALAAQIRCYADGRRDELDRLTARLPMCS
jgi:hypothetical protein